MYGKKIIVKTNKATVGDLLPLKLVCEHCNNPQCKAFWVHYENSAWLWNPNILRECEINAKENWE